jgi:hypothetical protein
MRAWLFAVVAGAALAQAGGALAQVQNYSEMQPPLPVAVAAGPVVDQKLPVKAPDPYVRKLVFLRDRVLYLKAKDGGRLTPEHAAALQRQLDELNRQADAPRN